MAKRSKKDISQISEKQETLKEPQDLAELNVPSLLIDGTEPKTKSQPRRKTASKPSLKKVLAAQDDEDPELTSLLLQVDKMLTEMTQSKWLNSDWPAMAIESSEVEN